ncbi:uncharacterized protein LOC134219125 [Armigeres subalbatus]|uniref:uncharacterized protein LOC134219125 n=1 Tax=Armigeres subalbatus TaxID=124917 RepID=UPI002ED57FF2
MHETHQTTILRMQLKSVVINFVSCAIIFSLMTYGYALTCNTCNDRDCDSGGIEFNCTADMILETHQLLVALNPSLDSVAPSTSAEYACFRLTAAVFVDTGFSIPFVEHGCTFQQTAFCDGWESDVVVNECHVCHTDRCNVVEPPKPTTTEGAVSPEAPNPSGTGAGADLVSDFRNRLVVGILILSLLLT